MTPASARRDTIYALSSGSLPAGVAVIRLSGPDALAIGSLFCGSAPAPRRAVVRKLRASDGTLIDKALVLALPGPGTFTGEDIFEFQCHGGKAVVAALLEALSRCAGTRAAEAGEFSLRAFLHGRADLTALEALADLIDAETEVQRRLALAQADGAQAALYGAWRGEMLSLRALLEADLDFSDENDVPAEVTDAAGRRVAALAEAVRRHLATAEAGEIIRDGFQVVLAGAPNAGKSSLLNALAQRDVAIVTPIAGTTRDVLSVALDLGGIKVILSDTAGLRDTDDPVEKIGVARALDAVTQAHLVLELSESGNWTLEGSNVLRVRSKADLDHLTADCGGLVVSAVNGDGVSHLIEQIKLRAFERSAPVEGGAIVSRARHRSGLEICAAHLDAFPGAFHTGAEFAAEELRLAARALGRITGEIDSEHVLGAIFSSFCIGK